MQISKLRIYKRKWIQYFLALLFQHNNNNNAHLKGAQKMSWENFVPILSKFFSKRSFVVLCTIRSVFIIINFCPSLIDRYLLCVFKICSQFYDSNNRTCSLLQCEVEKGEALQTLQRKMTIEPA